jgi:hypothetical protein
MRLVAIHRKLVVVHLRHVVRCNCVSSSVCTQYAPIHGPSRTSLWNAVAKDPSRCKSCGLEEPTSRHDEGDGCCVLCVVCVVRRKATTEPRKVLDFFCDFSFIFLWPSLLLLDCVSRSRYHIKQPSAVGNDRRVILLLLLQCQPISFYSNGTRLRTLE